MQLSSKTRIILAGTIWLISFTSIIIADNSDDILGPIIMATFIALIVWVVLLPSLHKKRPKHKKEDSSERRLYGGKNNPVRGNENAEPFFVVMDVETTGLIRHDGRPTKKILKERPDSFPGIVQISWLLMSNKYEVVSQKTYYIKQSAPIPEDAIAIHGISDKLCELEGKDLLEVLSEFAEDIKYCSGYVGHNVMFDKQVIEAECLRCNLPKPFTHMKRFDTMLMGQELMERYRFSLTDLAIKMMGRKQVEEILDGFHDAEGDAWLTANLFAWLHKHDYKGMRGRSFKKNEMDGGGCFAVITLITIAISLLISNL